MPRTRSFAYLRRPRHLNVQGLDWFMGSVLPKIRAQIPDCGLIIAGEAGKARRWPDGVVTLGGLSNIEEAYARASIVINPTLFGTGLAVKNIEALSFGKPLVTTAAGARGVGPKLSSAMRIAADEQRFVSYVVELLHNKTERDALAKTALATVQGWRNQQVANLDAAIRGASSMSRPVGA